MSERYSRVCTLPSNLYASGSPVVIEAGALLKDNDNGGILAQLKLKSIVPKTIKAVTVQISPLDTTNQPLGAPVIHQYLDLQVDRDTFFGHKTAVTLPDVATRGFNVSV